MTLFVYYDDVQFEKGSWRNRNRIKSISQNYGKASYFEEYAQGLFEIMDKSWTHLLDLSLALLSWLREQLGINTPTVLSSGMGIAGRNVERLIAIIRHLGGTVFYEGRSGMAYIDSVIFTAAGITMRFQEYVQPGYPLSFGHGSFFSCGPGSLAIVTGINAEKEHA